MIDFVIYRPDLLYDKLRKEIVEPGPELDKIKKIKRRIKNDYDQTLFYVRPDAIEFSTLAKSAMQRCIMKFITRQEAYAKVDFFYFVKPILRESLRGPIYNIRLIDYH